MEWHDMLLLEVETSFQLGRKLSANLSLLHAIKV
jgi:hypothetical protein